jgi:hypothetical protein
MTEVRLPALLGALRRQHCGQGAPRTKAEPSCACFDSHAFEVCRFKSARQFCWIDKDHSVPDMEDPHPKGPHTVRPGEDSARLENPIDFGEQPILQNG